jgi:hypothetical protein
VRARVCARAHVPVLTLACVAFPRASQVECWLAALGRDAAASALRAAVSPLFDKYVPKAMEVVAACGGAALVKRCAERSVPPPLAHACTSPHPLPSLSPRLSPQLLCTHTGMQLVRPCPLPSRTHTLPVGIRAHARLLASHPSTAWLSHPSTRARRPPAAQSAPSSPTDPPCLSCVVPPVLLVSSPA